MKHCILTLLALCLLTSAFGQKVVHTGRYAGDNAALKAAPVLHPRVVLMGDSITDFWPSRSPGLFEKHPNIIGRTIREEYSKDTVHPNAAGYARMERVLLDILSQ